MTKSKAIRINLKQPGRVVSVNGTRKRKPANPSRSSGPSNATVLNQFECALDDPFCTASYGAKIPDEYSLASEAATLRHRFTVSPSNSSEYLLVTPIPSVGSLGFANGASPTLSAISGNAGSWPVSTVVAKGISPTFATPTGYNLSAVYRSYRVVGWGVRLKNITAASNVAGDATVAILPTTGHAPVWMAQGISSALGPMASPVDANNQLRDITNWASLPNSSFSTNPLSFGVPFITGVDGIPTSETFTAAELAQTGGVVIKPKFHCPGSAWKFRKADVSTGAFGTLGPHCFVSAVAPGGASDVLKTADLDALNTDGHNIVLVKFGGSFNQLYEVEVVYHLEAIPQMNNSTSQVPTAFTASPVSPRPQLDHAINRILKSPWVEFVKHEGSRAFGNVVQMLPGLMTRAAMAAMA